MDMKTRSLMRQLLTLAAIDSGKPFLAVPVQCRNGTSDTLCLVHTVGIATGLENWIIFRLPDGSNTWLLLAAFSQEDVARRFVFAWKPSGPVEGFRQNQFNAWVWDDS